MNSNPITNKPKSIIRANVTKHLALTIPLTTTTNMHHKKYFIAQSFKHTAGVSLTSTMK